MVNNTEWMVIGSREEVVGGGVGFGTNFLSLRVCSLPFLFLGALMTSSFLECWGEGSDQKEVCCFALRNTSSFFSCLCISKNHPYLIINAQSHSYHESYPFASEASPALFQMEIMSWQAKSLCPVAQGPNYGLMFLGSGGLTSALGCSDWRGLLHWDLIANGLAPWNPELLEATAGLSASYCHRSQASGVETLGPYGLAAPCDSSRDHGSHAAP